MYAEWQADNGGGDSHEIVTLDNHFRALPVPMLTEEQKRDVALVTRHAREHVENMMDEIADEVEAACDRLDALASVTPHTEETP